MQLIVSPNLVQVFGFVFSNFIKFKILTYYS